MFRQHVERFSLHFSVPHHSLLAIIKWINMPISNGAHSLSIDRYIPIRVLAAKPTYTTSYLSSATTKTSQQVKVRMDNTLERTFSRRRMNKTWIKNVDVLRPLCKVVIKKSRESHLERHWWKEQPSRLIFSSRYALRREGIEPHYKVSSCQEQDWSRYYGVYM